jgi:rRNA maturation endonuclease Nob1
MIKKLTPRLLLLATATLIAASAQAQTSEQNVNVTIRPSQTVEQRVADEIKAKELKKAADEKLAAEEAAKIAATSPKALLSRARLVQVTSNTEFFEAVQLQNALRKQAEFDRWQLAIVDGSRAQEVTDIFIEIDRPLFTYTFTYQLTNRSNGIVLATGKVTAFDGNAAAPKLAQRIIEEIKIARGESKAKK